MKKSILLCSVLFLFVAMANTSFAQEDKSKRKSPPALASKKVNGVDVKIDYSQPSKKDRLVWGGLVKFDNIWRTGANEATTFEISADVKVQGKLLKAGKYAMFTIPGKEKWTIIFNTTANQWGAYSYDQSKDALRVEADATYGNSSVEKFTIDIADNGEVSMKWDDMVTTFQVQ
ncbi:MAG: DUF2911 domain-containing protein [bacterium]|nr:DUF2911 domain-containing protein [bacterium]